MRNAAAVARELSRARAFLRLDLEGLVVLTEAGTGPFALTAPLAAAAGARRVIAVAGSYGSSSAEDVANATVALASDLRMADRIEVTTRRHPDLFGRADVVTNLGFVRPLDRAAVHALSPTAAIAFMREAWEWRDGEVDLDACATRGIPVFATDEHHQEVRVFDGCGLLAVKLLLEAEVDLASGQTVVFSPDPFGPVIADAVKRIGGDVRLATSPAAAMTQLGGAAALIIADFNAAGWIVAPDAPLSPSRLADAAPDLKVIAFAGGVDAKALADVGLRAAPARGARPGRMGRTLADLGPHMLLRLHGAGLKVGAAAARGRAAGLRGDELASYVTAHSPAQLMNGGRV